jgi:hypothetical protein
VEVADAGPVLIAGPVTWDLIGGARVPGGAVSYAARTCAAFGIRAHVLTNCDASADLSALEGHEVHVVPASATLTYEHDFSSGPRRLRLIAHPERMLTVGDLPRDWPAFRTVIVAPLIEGDLDAEGFARAGADEVAVLAQGLQRRASAGEFVRELERPAPALLEAARGATVFLSSEEVARWPQAGLEALEGVARRVVVTDGSRGAEVRSHGRATRVEPGPAAAVVDTTGAGDVFASAFILALRAGEAAAGRLAAAYAAANVERPGAAPLPPLAEVEARLGASGPHGGASGEGRPS